MLLFSASWNAPWYTQIIIMMMMMFPCSIYICSYCVASKGTGSANTWVRFLVIEQFVARFYLSLSRIQISLRTLSYQRYCGMKNQKHIYEKIRYVPFPAKVQDYLWVETDRPTKECKPTHNFIWHMKWSWMPRSHG